MATEVTSISPPTELEAVNIILSGIGEAPVNTLENVGDDGNLPEDISLALSVLREISREVQLEGWSWNTEHNYPLSIDLNSREIVIPQNILQVYFRGPTSRRFTVRNRKIYDLERHTTIFQQGTKPPSFTVTLHLPFDELPEAAKRYITLKALRVYQERAVGSAELSRVQRDDEGRARALLLSEDNRVARHNMLSGPLAPDDSGVFYPWHTTIYRR
jgi:hypothetical protein